MITVQPTNIKQTPKLYLLTNEDVSTLLYKKLSIALASGVVSRLQIRRKHVQEQTQLYKEVATICRLADDYNCDLIINDDMYIAKEFGLGVHLGQEDGSVAQARAMLGERAIIGSTCHGSVELVVKAIQQGASYAAMGTVFTSVTKKNAKTISFDDLQQGSQMCQSAGVDFCVIGGITAQNSHQLNGLTISYFAVVNDILGGTLSEVEKRCLLWQDALENFSAYRL